MVDSGATQNLILMTMIEMLNAAAQGITWCYTAELLWISLADHSVILSSKKYQFYFNLMNTNSKR